MINLDNATIISPPHSQNKVPKINQSTSLKLMSRSSLLVSLLFFTIINISVCTIPCVVWKNIYLQYSPSTTPNVTRVTIWSTDRAEWTAIGFSATPSVKNATLLVIGSVFGVSLFSRHNETSFPIDTLLDSEFYNATVDQQGFLVVDKLTHFDFDVPDTYLTSNYFIFARGPISQNGVPMYHTFVGFKANPIYDRASLFEEGWCNHRWLKISGRFGTYNDYTFAIFFIFYALMMILSIRWRDDPLMRARGYGLILVSLAFLINLVADYIMTHPLNFEEYYRVDCIITPFLSYSSTAVCLIIVAVYFFRYIVIVNFNILRQKLITGNKSEDEVKNHPFIKLMKYATSPLVLIVVPITWFTIWSTYVAIILGIFGFQCGTNSSTVLRWSFIVVILGFSIWCGILQAWDVIQNWRLLVRCKLYTFFITEDRFLFRFQFLISFVAPVWVILWQAPIDGMASLGRQIFVEIAYFCAIWCSGLFIIIVLAVRKIFGPILCRKHSDSANSVLDATEKLFENQEGYELLLDFAKYEWSMENVYFKRKCIDYRASKQERRQAMAIEMREQFLRLGSSQFEINVPGDLCEKASRRIDAMKPGEFDDTLFVELEREVNMNIYDIMTRFTSKPQYILWKQKDEMLEN